jgi:hypothetical protein
LQLIDFIIAFCQIIQDSGSVMINREDGANCSGAWDGKDDSGLPAGSGIYWGVVEIGGIRQSCKMTLLR